MLNRTAIMKAAWAEYRRAARSLVRFCRETFARILRARWFATRLLAGRAGIMAAAWTRYREIAAQMEVARFDLRLFGRVLRMAWINARAAQERADSDRHAARPKALAARPLAALEEALDAVKYLPAHMSAARVSASIRARFAAHV
ncbi:hypothetical protein GCM10011390_10470 [Aureimonas endophytica]|uniref:Uncharacterized protein n=1 Tax=Aureimonas endophytica TaxID=2027858 RepID=A0A916ZG52_9HYPH|nr:hypothetical protein [Aureimonas endophytica]GGD93636.1 hypothetical protein GCM10011390_10470 [Aureimonas endophytica]